MFKKGEHRAVFIVAAVAVVAIAMAFMNSGGSTGAVQVTGYVPLVTGMAPSDEVVVDFASRSVFRDVEYVQATGFMKGSLSRPDSSTGTYDVPITLAYPVDPQDCNNVAFVDILNSVFFEVLGVPAVLPLGRTFVSEDHLFGNGNFYVGIQWNKLVTETTGDGTIERGTDGWEIIKDAANFARNPSGFTVTGPPGFIAPTCRGDTVIGFGYSQTGELLRQYYKDGRNSDGTFDGSVIAVGGGRCRDMIDAAPYYSYENCGGLLPQDGKVIAINAESDVDMLAGWDAREETPSYRVYEIAGVSHIPGNPFNLVDLGFPAFRQNFEDTRPVFKAMHENMIDWIEKGILPPPSVTMPGNVISIPMPLFDSTQAWGNDEPFRYSFDRDSDGNALGGIRLPHMPTTVDKRTFGSPLGTYSGSDDLAPDFLGDIFVRFGGSFEPFDESTVNARYRNHGAYVEGVSQAAAYAKEQRWILEEDVGTYARAATMSDIGK